MKIFEDMLIKDYLAEQKDEFEIAKVRLTLDFCIFFSVLFIITALAPALVGNPPALYINLATPPLFLFSIFLMKVFRSYKLGASLFCISVVLAATAHSIAANGNLTVMITVWYFIVILFSNLVLGKRASLAFMVATLVIILVIVWFRLTTLPYFNPRYYPDKALIGLVITLFFALAIIYRLLSEYHKLMKHALDDVIAAYRAKSSVLGIVAHDLRNPITAINALSAIIKEEAASAGTQGKMSETIENCEIIQIASNRVLDIIHELTEAEEIESIHGEWPKEKEELSHFLEPIWKLYSLKAQQKGVSLTKKYPAEPVFVEINRQRFSRAVENLISNGLKFTPKGGEVCVTLELKDNTVTIAVSDTGIGIPAEMQPKIFDRFTKARRVGTGGEKTTGLGLAITKEIVERHNGKIWFESVPDKGTTFYIQIQALET